MPEETDNNFRVCFDKQTHKHTLESNLVASKGIDGSSHGIVILLVALDAAKVVFVPIHWDIGRIEDGFDGLGTFLADTVARNQCDGVPTAVLCARQCG